MNVPFGCETDLVKSCIQLCQWSNVVADVWRNNTGGVTRINRDGSTRHIQFGRKGVSDILGILSNGRFLAIECKMPKGTLTHHQQDFLDRVDKAGGLALVVRDVAELQAALTHLALDPAWRPRKVI